MLWLRIVWDAYIDTAMCHHHERLTTDFYRPAKTSLTSTAVLDLMYPKGRKPHHIGTFSVLGWLCT